ncbi:MAG: molybdopterin-containing oxidoreductase catalytic subunit [Planctomycetota bacterium]|nr:MAG: molybdopterin-containing oxidoreductase catalytic subunit [Planctomycetota bacterium]
MAQVLRTACNRDCPDACGILATVEDGRVLRIQGDPEHPVTQGFLCRRTNRFVEERQYHPARLTSPLLRRDGVLTPVSWDEALDLAAGQLLRFRAESGPASIFHYRSAGSLGLLKTVCDFFFERFGPVTMKRGDICSGAGEAAQELDFGAYEANDWFDLRNARAVVLWGKNPHVSSVHQLPLLKEARAAGVKLALVDPVHQRTAALCDLLVQPRPGGDVHLALGVARVLFERGWTDPEAPAYCNHYGAFRELVFSRSLPAWAAGAGLRREEVTALAELYGANRPANIQVGWGLQRRGNGAAAVRALDALGLVTGNVGVPGGGVSFSTRRRSAFDFSFLRGLPAAPRSICEPLFGAEVLAAQDPPIRMVWVTAANPVAMLPDSHTVAEALRSREFTVVVDAFLTDTARCAHLVLPTTTMLEEDDVLGSYGHHWLTLMRAVVPPPPGVKTDLEIMSALAERVGLGQELRADPRAWMERLLQRVDPQGAGAAALEQGPVRNPEAPPVLFAGRRFPTSDGRANLVHELPRDIPRPTLEFPLYLTSISSDRFQASQARPEDQEGPAEARLHPHAALGLPDGALALLQSRIGEMTVRLRHDAAQRRDVVLVDKGGWLSAGRCANALVQATTTDRGEGAAYYDETVRVVPAAPLAESARPRLGG